MTGQLNVTETEAAADQPAKVSAKPSQSKHGSTQSSQSGDGKIPPKHVKKGKYTNTQGRLLVSAVSGLYC